MTRIHEFRSVLDITTEPDELVTELLNDATDLWLTGESPDVVAADVALCDPPLAPEEVRVSISAAQIGGALRVSVLAHDRPGLLATTAGVLASNGLSIVQAAATTWPSRRWAVQRFLVVSPRVRAVRPADRDLLRARLRAAVASADRPAVPFAPEGAARVTVDGDIGGRRLVRVSAPDRPGLLWAISGWLDRHGCNIVAARAAPLGPAAEDAFLVEGDPDEAGLSAYLSGEPAPVALSDSRQ